MQRGGLRALARRVGRWRHTGAEQGDVDRHAQAERCAALVCAARPHGQSLAAAQRPAHLRLVTRGHCGGVLAQRRSLRAELCDVGGAHHVAVDGGEFRHVEQHARQARHAGQAVAHQSAQAQLDLAHLRLRSVLRQLGLLHRLARLNELAGPAAVGTHDGFERLDQAAHLAHVLAVDLHVLAIAAAL